MIIIKTVIMIQIVRTNVNNHDYSDYNNNKSTMSDTGCPQSPNLTCDPEPISLLTRDPVTLFCILPPLPT